ncbi:hypothetical protein FHR61_004009 [Xanthomonas arboricola]|uniref:Uncharacterized protein n=1 Tax=Xanthomonas cannabis TaxID=1885674 RepID=A0ABR6JG64_9XANT|nr:hypothetical protein [Xanthomonas cannabis]MBB5524118.1 hypothetical protein [Xanthomonas cannabis]
MQYSRPLSGGWTFARCRAAVTGPGDARSAACRCSCRHWAQPRRISASRNRPARRPGRCSARRGGRGRHAACCQPRARRLARSGSSVHLAPTIQRTDALPYPHRASGTHRCRVTSRSALPGHARQALQECGSTDPSARLHHQRCSAGRCRTARSDIVISPNIYILELARTRPLSAAEASTTTETASKSRISSTLRFARPYSDKRYLHAIMIRAQPPIPPLQPRTAGHRSIPQIT